LLELKVVTVHKIYLLFIRGVIELGIKIDTFKPAFLLRLATLLGGYIQLSVSIVKYTTKTCRFCG